MIDVRSATWGAILAWIKKELAEDHALLADKTCSDKDADQLRGGIEKLNKLLNLPSEGLPKVAARTTAEAWFDVPGLGEEPAED